MTTFHFSPGACSMAPHIALEEAGMQFDPKPISLAKGQHKSPDYLKINPNGQVPTLVVDGKTLTENVAILTWIAEQHPAAKLMPTDPWERIQALSYLARLTSDVHKTFTPLFRPQAYVSDDAARDDFVKNVRGLVAERMTGIDARLAGKDYALGQFSVVDCYLYVFFAWASHLGFDTGAWPNYARHFERMKSRPAVQRMQARESAAQEKLNAA